MKRFITCAICILSLNIVKADARLVADTTAHINAAINSPQKNYHDTIAAPLAQVLPGYYQNSIYKLRLDSIQKDVPLDYNEYVQNYIDIYTRHKDEMSHVLGLAKYYFPIYEKAFHEAGIPEEIKYLSIVESKLDPTAVSRVGATGPWQFMSATAKLYGLNMDEYVDERRDPVQASYAAAAYLKDAYMEFGDWLLAIASYNCGKSNIERAIQKAGGAIDFWSIRPYLPVETRNYVPAYIAVAYVMNYAGKHSILPQPWSLSAKTDMIFVDKFVSLNNISKILNMSVRELSLLNPAYKKQIINGTAATPRRLVIPKPAQEYYAALYDALNTDTVAQPTLVNGVDHQEKKVADFHKVKRGETLVAIADAFGIDLQDLKDWNNLHSNKAAVGKRLWLNDDHRSIESSSKDEPKFITYKVKRGDTLRVIAGKFDGNSPESIRSLNGLKKGALQPGMVLKISHG